MDATKGVKSDGTKAPETAGEQPINVKSPAPDKHGWLPIETAPKYGEPIDIWCSTHKIRHPDCSWCYPDYCQKEQGKAWCYEATGDCNYNSISTSVVNPTHWMPLPPPPEREA